MDLHRCGQASGVGKMTMVDVLKKKQTFATRVGFGLRINDNVNTRDYKDKVYFKEDDITIYFKRKCLSDMQSLVNYFMKYVKDHDNNDSVASMFKQGLVAIYN